MLLKKCHNLQPFMYSCYLNAIPFVWHVTVHSTYTLLIQLPSVELYVILQSFPQPHWRDERRQHPCMHCTVCILVTSIFNCLCFYFLQIFRIHKGFFFFWLSSHYQFFYSGGIRYIEEQMNTVCNTPRGFTLSISIKVIIHCLDPLLLMDNILCLCASSLMQFIHVCYLAYNWKYVDNKAPLYTFVEAVCGGMCLFYQHQGREEAMGLVV